MKYCGYRYSRRVFCGLFSLIGWLVIGLIWVVKHLPVIFNKEIREVYKKTKDMPACMVYHSSILTDKEKKIWERYIIRAQF